MRNWSLLTAVLASLAIVGCDGRDPIDSTPDAGNPTPTRYAIGGTVSGLAAGRSVVLKTAANDVATVSANGTFVFPAKLTTGTAYAVTVQTQPTGPSQTCTVANGTGTVATADVTNIAVTCATDTFTVGGTIAGLTGTGLKLKNNGGDELTVNNGATSFTFATKVASGAAYAVTVSAQPAGQSCTVSAGSGTVGAGNVTSPVVNCAALRYTVGGTVTGLVGSLTLGLTAGSTTDSKTVSAAGAFAFTQTLTAGTTYTVAITAQPATQTCTITAGATGTTVAANVTNITVACVTDEFTIGGNVAGLTAGESVVLSLNGTEDAPVTADGAFTFNTKVVKTNAYAVTIKTQPTAPLTCSVSNGTGTATANVNNVSVTCSTVTFTVGGSVTGLGAGKSVTLSNGQDSKTVSADGAFTFDAAVAQGSSYDVTVTAQPAGQNCTVASGSGTANADVTNVAVTCVDNPTVSVNVTGLNGGTLVLQNNAADDLSVTANGTATFAPSIVSGGAYAVTVKTQPAGQTCTPGANASGTLTANVTVDVTCAAAVVIPNVMVLRLGRGGATAPVSNASEAVSLVEFAAQENSAPVRTVDVDSSATGISVTYSSGSEGSLNRSADGHLVTFAGFRAAAGTPTVRTTSGILRSVAKVTAAGTASFVDLPVGAFGSDAVRSAATVDGTAFWVSGTSSGTTGAGGTASGGMWYVPESGTAVRLVENAATLTAPNNMRWVGIFDGQLYFSSASGSFIGVGALGTGLPTTAPQAATMIPGTDAYGSPYGFALVDTDSTPGPDVLYVSYDSSPTGTPTPTNTINIQKFVLSGTTWTRQTSFAPVFAAGLVGTRSVTATRLSNGTTAVYAVTGNGTSNALDNRVVYFIDDGGNTPTVNTISTGPDANFKYRGIALAPVP